MTTLVARPERVRTASQRYQLTAVAHYRLMVLLLLFVAATALIGLRLLWLGVFSDGAGGRHGPASLVPVRADIVDRHGVPLARTMDAWSIAVKPAEVLGDRVELAESLHEIFPDQSAASFHRLLTAKKKFVYLRRRALPDRSSRRSRLWSDRRMRPRSPRETRSRAR